ncbi:hypothetical protein [Aequorivita capsosiphonis]|uniref:PglD-related sugar-binding protein n=1 Tax=Aequorivita capsosiphonis TaxID=487317 RepID=UPI00041BE1D2|nr:hypothetical protein [Aequorivita capsosiphonis]
MKKHLLIIGSGGLGREILATLKHTNYLFNYNGIGFIDEKPGTVKGVNIVGDNKYLHNIEFDCDIIIAIGNVNIRRKIIEEFGSKKNFNFPTFIHPKASLYDEGSIKIGKGCYIGETSILTTDIVIEDYCFINSNVSIHHDSILRENCVLMPGARITGGAEIGKDTRIGPNVQLSQRILVPANSNLEI